MADLKKLFEKYKDVIPYLFFGVCTTLVNIFTYWICAHLFSFNTLGSTMIAWTLAVLFAYLTNRKYVFYSEADTRTEIIKEILYFFGARLATGAVDLACMWFFVDILDVNDLFIKTAANVLVIILNYLASKLLIFRKKSS